MTKDKVERSRVSLALTEADYLLVRQAAEREFLTPATYCRQAVLRRVMDDDRSEAERSVKG